MHTPKGVFDCGKDFGCRKVRATVWSHPNRQFSAISGWVRGEASPCIPDLTAKKSKKLDWVRGPGNPISGVLALVHSKNLGDQCQSLGISSTIIVDL